jgi:hypothetical protein
VWVKEVDLRDERLESANLRTLGVGRFVVADAWGRSND